MSQALPPNFGPDKDNWAVCVSTILKSTSQHFGAQKVIPAGTVVYLEEDMEAVKQRNLELLAMIEKMIEAANCINHWHDWGKEDEGMVVSHDSVIHLWEVAASADVAIHGEDKSQALREHEAKIVAEYKQRAEAAEAKLRELEWRSIETAPKDGTKILIREKCGRIQVARWSCPGGPHYDWYVQLTSSGSDAFPTLDVIQWMPLPAV